MVNGKIHLYFFREESETINSLGLLNKTNIICPWESLSNQMPKEQMGELMNHEGRFILFATNEVGNTGEFIWLLKKYKKEGAAIYCDGESHSLIVTLFLLNKAETIKLTSADLVCARDIPLQEFYHQGIQVICLYLQKNMKSFLMAADEIRKSKGFIEK